MRKLFYLNLWRNSHLKAIRIKSSIPKFLPLCPCFSMLSRQQNLVARVFEASVGAQLLRLHGDLYYWRERDKEVDFVFCFKKKIYAIEVKFGKKKSLSGMEAFLSKFNKAIPVFVDRGTMRSFCFKQRGFF